MLIECDKKVLNKLTRVLIRLITRVLSRLTGVLNKHVFKLIGAVITPTRMLSTSTRSQIQNCHSKQNEKRSLHCMFRCHFFELDFFFAITRAVSYVAA